LFSRRHAGSVMPRRERRSWAGSFSHAVACWTELKERLYLSVVPPL